ncbi:MAG: hypothetical protein JW982_10365 [Spirochaetes bacterium]|nr:hypothetical protein [Spirochaetota bacterium]
MKIGRLTGIFCAIVFITLFFSGMLNAVENIENDILKIRKQYQEIESNIKNLDKMESEGITGYYDPENKQLVKITTALLRDWYEENCSFYFHEGELFFIFIERCSGEEMFTTEELGITEEQLWQSGWEAKTLKFSQDRIYVKKNKCIRYLSREKVLPVSNTNPELYKVKDHEVNPSEYDISIIETGILLFKNFKLK